MTDIEQRLQDAQRRIDAQNTRRARAELQKEQAEETLASLKLQLKEEFGVTTGAEIKAKRADLEAEIEKLTAEIEQELEAAGA